MNPLDFINITTISIVLLIIGALGIILLVKPLDKIIMFVLMEGGFLLAIVSFKYLDVALVVALFGPISTVIFLLSMIKLNEIRQRNKNNQETPIEGDSR
jgi:energy-converting hydrogenase A subunit D